MAKLRRLLLLFATATLLINCALAGEREARRRLSDIAVDSSGSVYVLDNARDEVLKLDANGKLVWNTTLTMPDGKNSNSYRLALGDSGGVLVVSNYAGVRLISASGELTDVCPWPGMYTDRIMGIDSAGRLYFPNKEKNTVDVRGAADCSGPSTVVIDGSGPGPGHLGRPHKVDVLGNLWVLDQSYVYRIYDPAGKFLYAVKAPDAKNRSFTYVIDAETDGRFCYLACMETRSILKYDSGGRLIGKIPTGQPARGFGLGPKSEFYVGDEVFVKEAGKRMDVIRVLDDRGRVLKTMDLPEEPLTTPELAPRAAGIPPPEPVGSDMLVGVYYFPGWSRVDRWYCIAASDTAQHPLLGYYREGDPDAADWHIKWALEHGVSFFSFDYYTAGGTQMYETALDEGFLKSKFIDRFRFCLNWCNHANISTMTAAELEHFADIVIPKYLTHPSYLRIDGEPLVQILSGNGFVKNLGVDAAKQAFDRFEQRCKEAGLPGVYLAFCEGDVHSEQDVKDALAAGADAFCRYNYPYSGTEFAGPGKYGEATYEHLVEQGRKDWEHWRKITDGRFWPTVMPGWDRRPWTKDADLVRTGSTPDLFGRSLSLSREHVNSQKIVMIEAWNEWGEGSVLEPSTEHGFAYLDRVREVFCPKAGKHSDTGPKSLGLRQPIFEMELPATDRWTFDFDTEDWTGTAISGLQRAWGALKLSATTDDPQISSPITYLDCKDYARAVIRMRAQGPAGGPKTTTGQLFWSTVDTGMSGEASVAFEVPLDDKWQEYSLELTANERWKGRTDRIRLDPASAAGVEIGIDEIRFVRK